MSVLSGSGWRDRDLFGGGVARDDCRDACGGCVRFCCVVDGGCVVRLRVVGGLLEDDDGLFDGGGCRRGQGK